MPEVPTTRDYRKLDKPAGTETEALLGNAPDPRPIAESTPAPAPTSASPDFRQLMPMQGRVPNSPMSETDSLLGEPAAPASQTDSLLSGVEDTQKFQTAVQYGADKSPNEAARILRLKEATALPEDLIERNTDKLMRMTRRDQFDAHEFAKRSPITSEWLSESPNRTAATWDILPTLGRMEDFFTKEPHQYARPIEQLEKIARARAKKRLQEGYDKPHRRLMPSGAEGAAQFEESYYQEELAKLREQEAFISGDEPVGIVENTRMAFNENKAAALPHFNILGKADNATQLLIASQALIANTVTPEQMELLTQTARINAAAQRRGLTTPAEIAAAAASSFVFSAEFATTPGYHLVKGLIEKGGVKLSAKLATKGIIDKALQLALKGAGWAAGSQAQSLVNPGRIIEGTISNVTPRGSLSEDGKSVEIDPTTGQPLGQAIKNAVVTDFANVASERTGEAVVLMGRVIGKTIFSKLSPALQEQVINLAAKIPRTELSDKVGKVLEAGGFHGIGPEMIETEIGKLMEAAGGVKPYEAPSLHELGVEAAAFSIPGVVHAAARKVGEAKTRTKGFTDYGNNVKKVMEADVFKDADGKAVLEKFLGFQAENAGRPSVLMPIEAWNQYWIDKGQDPGDAAVQIIGSREGYDEANENGTDLVIPTAKWAVNIGPTEHNKFFAKELRWKELEHNEREAEEERKAIEQAEADAQKDAAEPKEPSPEVKQLQGLLVQSGVAEDQALANAQALEKLMIGAGMSPKETMLLYPLFVQQGTPTKKDGGLEQEKADHIVPYEAVPAKEYVEAADSATPETKEKITKEVTALLIDSDGKSVIAKELGLPGELGTSRQSGYYGSQVSPNIVTEFQGVPASEIRRFARALQLILRQAAVPYFTPVKDPTDTSQLSYGVAITLGVQLDDTTQQKLGDILRDLGLGPDAGFTKVSANRIVIINFKNKATGQTLYGDDGAFLSVLSKLQEQYGREFQIEEIGEGWFDGEYLTHDWAADRDGEALLAEADPSGRSDVRARLGSYARQYDQISEKHFGPRNPVTLNQGPVGSNSGRGSAGRRSGQEEARGSLQEVPRLKGLPDSSPGPIAKIKRAAQEYVGKVWFPTSYVKADPERGKRIADAYEQMPHAPNDPKVKRAYKALIKETLAQYQIVKDLGIKIEVIKPGMENPYPEGPRQVLEDLRNGHLWLFPTEAGFGSENQAADHPLLAKTKEKIGDHVLLANDVFRIVHDVFGHGKEGNGFGPHGEENAWQSHMPMYSPLAAQAMTTETRGQNSWVNFGKLGETNQANKKDTVYADQKAGLLPDWVMAEGLAENAPLVLDQSALPAKSDLSPLGFYSQVAREVEKMDFKEMPAKDLWNRIKNIQGIKAEELEQLGLQEWLNGVANEKEAGPQTSWAVFEVGQARPSSIHTSQDFAQQEADYNNGRPGTDRKFEVKEHTVTPTGKVLKQEVLDFIKGNGVQVEQVVLADDFESDEEESDDDTPHIADLEWSEATYMSYRNISRQYYGSDPAGKEVYERLRYGDEFEGEELQKQLDEWVAELAEEPEKYADTYDQAKKLVDIVKNEKAKYDERRQAMKKIIDLEFLNTSHGRYLMEEMEKAEIEYIESGESVHSIEVAKLETLGLEMTRRYDQNWEVEMPDGRTFETDTGEFNEAKIQIAEKLLLEGHVRGQTSELVQPKDIVFLDHEGEEPSEKTIEKKARLLYKKEGERLRAAVPDDEIYSETEKEKAEDRDRAAYWAAKKEVRGAYKDPANKKNSITIKIKHPLLTGTIVGNNVKGWKLDAKVDHLKDRIVEDLGVIPLEQVQQKALDALEEKGAFGNRQAEQEQQAEDPTFDVNAPTDRSRHTGHVRSSFPSAKNFRELIFTSPQAGDYSREYGGQDHYHMPKQLASAIIADATGPNGEKMLLLVESQSDRHSNLRNLRLQVAALQEKQKDKPASTEEYAAARAALLTQLLKVDNLGFDSGSQAADAILQEEDYASRWDIEGEPEVIAAAEAYRAASTENRIKKLEAMIAKIEAPYENTEAWLGLVMKNIIRMAVQQGYDTVAWSPAEIVTERWGTDQVSWKKKPGNHVVMGRVSANEPWFAVKTFDTLEAAEAYQSTLDIESNVKSFEATWLVSTRAQVGGEVNGMDLEEAARQRGLLLEKHGERVTSFEELEKLVKGESDNPNFAKNLWKRMQTEESGLKASRKEGFEFEYDNLLPKKVVPGILKKLDKNAKVSVATIDSGKVHATATYVGPTKTAEELLALVKEDTRTAWVEQELTRLARALKDNPAADFDKEAAKQLSDESAEAIGGLITRREEPKMQDVWQVKLTDEMKAKAKTEGFSLFQPSQNDSDARGQIKLYNDHAQMILPKWSDASTVPHEFAHYFLQIMGILSEMPDASQKVKDRYAAALKFLGVESKDQLTEEHHEKFARSFESYLLNGEAPTAQLKDLFKQFKEWLKAVYKAAPPEVLTPEAKEFFDSIFAAEAEVEQARAQQMMTPLFKDMKAAGFSDEQALSMQAAIQEAQEASQAELTAKTFQEADKKRSKEYEENRELVRSQIEEEVSHQPVYIALSILQKGTMPDGTELPESLAGLKLDAKALKKEWPGQMKSLPKPYVYAREGGVHPDVAAEMLGFGSGSELITAMVEAEPMNQLVDRLTDEQMKAQFPSLQETGALSVEAMKAIHNDKQDELYRKELEYMLSEHFAKFKQMTRRIAGRPPAPTASIKEQAAEAIAKKQVRETNPLLYQRAEAKAGKEAADLLLKGDFAGAVEAKTRQRYNHALYRAAVEAKENAEKAAEYMRKFDKASVRERMGKAGSDYLEQIEAILERFGFNTVSGKAIDRKNDLRAWVEAQREEGIAVDLPEKLLSEAFRKNYKELTNAELAEVRETVENIEHLARLKNKLLTNEKVREIEEAEAMLLSTIEAHHQLKDEVLPLAPGLKDKILQNKSKFFAAHTRMEFLFEFLDGVKSHGAFWNLMFKPFVEAEAAEAELAKKDTEALARIFSVYTRAERAEWFGKPIFIAEAKTDKFDGNINKAGILAIALNWGNEYNRQALMEGYGWDERQVLKILEQLDEKDVATVNALWAHIDTYWEAARDLQKEMTGVAPQKVQGSPAVIRAGKLNGGYYPIKFDHDRSYRQLQLDEKAALGEQFGHATRAMTRHGHLIERTSTGGKPLLLNLTVLSGHLSQVRHDVTHRRAIIDVGKLVNRPKIRAAIIGAAGSQMYRQLNPWLKGIAGDTSPDLVDGWEPILSLMRTNMTKVNLGLKATSGLVQTLGYFNAAHVLGVKYARRGLRALNPVKLKENWAFITERSAMMKNRLDNYDRDVRDIVQKQNVVQGADDAWFYHIGFMDLALSVPAWMGAYEKAMDGEVENIDKGDEKSAVEYADSTVRKTMAAGAAKDLAQVQRGNELKRLFTAFYSQLSIQFNLLQQAGQHFALTKDFGRLASAATFLWFLPAILDDVIKGRGPDDEDEWLPWVTKKAATYPFQTMVFMRDIVNMMERRFETGRRADYTMSPVVQGIESVANASYSLAKPLMGEELTRGDAKDVTMAAGYMVGLPSRQVWMTSEYLYDYMTGEVQPSNPAEAAWRALVTGKPKEK